MSEPGESLKWNEGELPDEDFSWFDAEWEKWQDHPEMQPGYENDMIAWRARQEQVLTVIFDELDARDIRRYVDNDPIQQHALCQDFLASRHEASLTELQRTVNGVRMYINDDHHIKAAFNNAVTFRELYKFQEQVIADTAMLLSLYICINEGQLEEGLLDLVDIKKKIQAKYLMHHMRSMNDRWQVFFDEMTPGEGFDSGRPADEWYLQEAEEGVVDAGKEYQKDRRVLRRAMNVAGVKGVKGDSGAVLRLTVNVVEMQNIAATPYPTNRATRNERLFDYGRLHEMDEKVVMELAKLFDEQYPVD